MSNSTPIDPAAGDDHTVETQAFFFAPIPPEVPPDCPSQRWMQTPEGRRHVANACSIYRNRYRDVAEVGISIFDSPGGQYARVGKELDASQLRQLAALLLCAAHDIEAHPASGGGA